MYEFVPYEEKLDADWVVALVQKLRGRRLYAAHINEWDMYVLADEPITPEKVRGWWNEELSPNDDDYAFNPPKLSSIKIPQVEK